MSLLSRIDPTLLDGALAITRRLHAAGYQAYFAGGAVRDLLLGRELSDIDIATAAPPDVIQGLFGQTLAVGAQFGVIVVVVPPNQYEVATFRKETGYQDGRHPGQVESTDAREDALRRDFTVNALFLDPEGERILDFVGGQTDLEKRLIRTVGQARERFEEDKLRILRAIRFACALDFEIDSDTLAAIPAFSSTIRQVSMERIRDELLRLLTESGAARGLPLLLQTGILEVILPEVAAMSGVEQPPEFHPEGDVFIHTCLMFEYAGKINPALALGILLHDVGKPPTFRVEERIRFDGHAEVGAEMAHRICHQLRLSNELTHRVVDLVRDHLKFIHVQDMRESTLKRFLRREDFVDHLELHRLDCLSSHRNLSNYDFCKAKLEEFGKEVVRPKPLLNGHDLISEGFKPGPLFSEILTDLEDQQLEGSIQTREEAFAWLRKHPKHAASN